MKASKRLTIEAVPYTQPYNDTKDENKTTRINR